MNKQSYRGIVIHPDLATGRCAGEITINALSVSIACPELVHSFALSEVRISAGGAGNRYVFFTSALHPEVSVYTDDRSILKNSTLMASTRFAADIKSSGRVLRKLMVGSLVAVAVVAVAVLGLFLAKDSMVRGIANQVPVSWEKKAGDQLFTTITASHEMVKNDSLKKIFMKAAAPLLDEVRREGFPVEVYFVKDGTVNAFALPGGKVVVQTGLIESAQSWEEVMGVLAHELAHVTHRHHIRWVINNVGLFAILAATLGDVSALAGTFANMGGELASLANSRSFEREADQGGWNYLVNGRIDPRGMIRFFEILEKKQTDLEKLPLSIVSTHPDTKSRIATLKGWEKKLTGRYTPIAGSYADFKRALCQ